MKKIIYSLIFLSVLVACNFEKTQVISNTQLPSEDQFIDSVIASMSLEQKVGQMTNLTLATVADEVDGEIVLDQDKLKDVFVDHNIGSIQNVISHAYTLDQWHDLVFQLQKYTMENTSRQIPFLYCIDAVHGTNYTLGSTLFPHNLALGATRNRSLLEKVGQITAMETRASGIHYNFSPVLDCGREQMWSRFAETFGEDIFVVSELGAANIKGLEGDDISDGKHVAACMKHYIGYGVPENGRDRAPAYIPEINLREYFLPSFKKGVDLGTRTLMVNSGEVNGVPVHASKFLLTDVLRGELGYEGVVITDWQDIIKLQERHQVASSHKEAVYLSVTAGIDMCIVPYDLSFYDDLISLVKEGRIDEERIDQSVRRILALKKELGLWENPYVDKSLRENFALDASKETALETAREAMTLLKNEEGILPIGQDQKILVTGQMSNSLTALNGAWSYSWQGQESQWFNESDQTISEAISEKFPNATYIPSDDKGVFDEAKRSDVIVVCLGEEAYAETPGNSPTIELEKEQLSLFSELAKAGKPIVLVLVEGRPKIIREIEPMCQGVIMAYWPSSYGSIALAELLAGEYSPSGKLPFTYPRYAEERITYDHKKLSEAMEIAKPYKYYYEFEPQYEFGEGLSYTSFEFDKMQLNKDTLTFTDTIRAQVAVTNTGDLDSKYTLEVYSRDHYASVTPSVRRLRAFKKELVKKGEKVVYEFEIPVANLSFIGQDMQPTIEEGMFDLIIEDQVKEIYIKP